MNRAVANLTPKLEGLDIIRPIFGLCLGSRESRLKFSDCHYTCPVPTDLFLIGHLYSILEQQESIRVIIPRESIVPGVRDRQDQSDHWIRGPRGKSRVRNNKRAKTPIPLRNIQTKPHPLQSEKENVYPSPPPTPHHRPRGIHNPRLPHQPLPLAHSSPDPRLVVQQHSWGKRRKSRKRESLHLPRENFPASAGGHDRVLYYAMFAQLARGVFDDEEGGDVGC